MTKENLSQLVTELADNTAGMSEKQRQLLESVERHIHKWDEPEPIDPSIMEILEVLMRDIENDHPKASAITERCIEVLRSIGV
jgi:hypothetical protein